MPAAALDPCAVPINPACIAQQAAGTVQTSASDYLLGGLGRAFIESAAQVARASYASLDQTTGIDLTASWFRGNVTVIAAVTLPVVVGLTGDEYDEPVAFDSVFGTAMLACAALIAAGGVVSWFTIPRHVLEDASTLDPREAGEG